MTSLCAQASIPRRSFLGTLYYTGEESNTTPLKMTGWKARARRAFLIM